MSHLFLVSELASVFRTAEEREEKRTEIKGKQSESCQTGRQRPYTGCWPRAKPDVCCQIQIFQLRHGRAAAVTEEPHSINMPLFRVKLKACVSFCIVCANPAAYQNKPAFKVAVKLVFLSFAIKSRKIRLIRACAMAKAKLQECELRRDEDEC